MGRDRLEELERKLRRKKLHGTQLLWVKYNPDATYKYDLVDAREDVEWMIHEIRQLREENAMLRELLDSLKAQIAEELGQNSTADD